jgi:hypothetical protein
MEPNLYTEENEITSLVQLCDQNGSLNPKAIGYSKSPLYVCNLKGHFPRKKKWNYWCITNKDMLFSITISNIDYLGMVFAYFLDLKTNEFIEQTVTTLLGTGCDMNETVFGDLAFHNQKMSVEFIDDGKEISIHVNSPVFGKEQLDAQFHINRPVNHETLNVVIPWSEDRFQFTSKQTCLPASGKLLIGNREILFDQQESYACLDFGRGIWKYESKWNWASFAGKSEGHTIGVNLGGQWTDGTGFTENGIIIDGKLIKIGSDISFIYDKQDYMKPWQLKTTNVPAINLTFTPVYERIARTDLAILRSEVHQMIGHFNGELVDEKGQVFVVSNLVGWAEDHSARW